MGQEPRSHSLGPLDLGLDEVVVRRDWPNLNPGGVSISSPDDDSYNCAAWAANDTARWWEPSPYRSHYWPPSVARQATLASYEAAYGTLGYERCADPALESGYEKIAVYTDESGSPVHVARQLVTGRWTSKLGQLKDIEHQSLDDLAGGLYGQPRLFMRKPQRSR